MLQLSTETYNNEQEVSKVFGQNFSWTQERRHGSDGGNSPLLLTKAIFVNRLKPMRKYCIWGMEGDVTNHTRISACVCHKWFSKIGFVYPIVD